MSKCLAMALNIIVAWVFSLKFSLWLLVALVSSKLAKANTKCGVVEGKHKFGLQAINAVQT